VCGEAVSAMTLAYKHRDGAWLGVRCAARVVSAVRLLHRGDHQAAACLLPVLSWALHIIFSFGFTSPSPLFLPGPPEGMGPYI
jgi:hypothetical protein